MTRWEQVRMMLWLSPLILPILLCEGFKKAAEGVDWCFKMRPWTIYLYNRAQLIEDAALERRYGSSVL